MRHYLLKIRSIFFTSILLGIMTAPAMVLIHLSASTLYHDKAISQGKYEETISPKNQTHDYRIIFVD